MSATKAASDTEQVVSTTVRPHSPTMKLTAEKVFKSAHFEFRFHNPDLSANTPQAQAHTAAPNGAEHIRFWNEWQALTELRFWIHRADFKIPLPQAMEDAWIVWQNGLAGLKVKVDGWKEE